MDFCFHASVDVFFVRMFRPTVQHTANQSYDRTRLGDHHPSLNTRCKDCVFTFTSPIRLHGLLLGHTDDIFNCIKRKTCFTVKYYFSRQNSYLFNVLPNSTPEIFFLTTHKHIYNHKSRTLSVLHEPRSKGHDLSTQQDDMNCGCLEATSGGEYLYLTNRT